MQDAIRAFNTQFRFNPEIVNEDNLQDKKEYIVCGMGGSHLAADLIQTWDPTLPVTIHNDYGLDAFSQEKLKNSLVILSSYSGNTEEVVDCYAKAKELGLAMAVITVGGKLMEFAKEDSIPYIQMPDTGIQPRSALGYNFRSLLKLMGLEEALKNTDRLVNTLDTSAYEQKGKELADKLKDKVPVVYSSKRNFSLAYNWKIKLNETGKIPAFYNVFPELNHNEMNGLDVVDSVRHLSEKLCFVFLRDEEDNPRNQKRMDVCAKLYKERGLSVEEITIEGKDKFEKIFNTLLFGDWLAVYIAESYGLESEQVPMVEEFKKLIA